MKFTRHLLVIAVLITTIISCRKENINTPSSTQNEISLAARNLANGGIAEDFETGSKTSYAIANVTLGTGSWSLDEALIGNTTSDRKVGTQSARVRNTGKLQMNFNFANGASTVVISHALYGTDGSSTWQLWKSTNSGSTWTQVGSTITTSSTSLTTATFTVNQSGSVRFSIRKVSGGTNRINIDEITINPYSTGGGGPIPGDNDHILMGNPSGAIADAINSPNNYFMNKTYYAMSYSKARATANWVSWHIYSGDLGSAARQDDFRADASLPTGWYRPGSTSYSGSGFDRGHNCPSADRTLTTTANSSTFLMSNMIPQAPQNNQQTWNNMESYIRSLITAGNEVYVIMGAYGTGGTGSNGTASTIDAGRITVPNRIWKVVVVIPNGNSDLSRVTTSTRVIAVNTPNINTTSSDWKTYRTSVDAIEAATGYNLLSNLPSTVQNAIEAVVDNQ